MVAVGGWRPGTRMLKSGLIQQFWSYAMLFAARKPRKIKRGRRVLEAPGGHYHPSGTSREGVAMNATQSGLPPKIEPDDQARPHVIEMLDALRRQREAYQVHQPRCVLLARQHGLTFAEIAEYIGMSESGVRYIIDTAGMSPGGDR